MCLTSLAFHNILITGKVQSIQPQFSGGWGAGGGLGFRIQDSHSQFSWKGVPNRLACSRTAERITALPLKWKELFSWVCSPLSIILLRDGKWGSAHSVPCQFQGSSRPGRISSRVSNVFHAFYCSSTMQIKNAGVGPTISHRISHSRLATAPKAFVSSLEILPNVILGCDLIEEAHRDSMTITVPAVIGCPVPESASMGLSGSADKQNSAANTFSSHHNKTMPEITQPIPHWQGRGRGVIGGGGGRRKVLVLTQEGLQVLTWTGCLMKHIFKPKDARSVLDKGGFKRSSNRASWGWPQFILLSRLNKINKKI